MRTLVVRFMLLALVCWAAPAQRLLVDSDTVEGQLLQAIDAEADGGKKVQLLEVFATKYPNHEAATWVLGLLQTAALEKKDYDRVLELATRILALDPEDVAAAHNALRAVEAKSETALVKRWSMQTSIIARRVVKSKAPEDPEEIADWKARVEFAKQVEVYTEYSLYFAAFNTKDPSVKTELVETLEARNPKSEYLAQMRAAPATIARQVDIEEAVRSAEQGFAKGEYNLDLLYMTATHHMQKRSSPDKVVSYGLKVLELLAQGTKPNGIDEADSNRRKTEMLGQTSWMVGVLLSTQEKFALADTHLRTALNYIKDQDMIAGALYHLGYINYRLAEAGDRIRIHDAVKFTSDCAKIQSSVQGQAAVNLKSMRAEYALPDKEEE